MSDTTIQVKPPAKDSSGFPATGAVLISVFALLAYMMALIIAYLAKNTDAMVLLFGVAAANASQVISFWVGSSAGSQRKDAKMPDILPLKLP